LTFREDKAYSQRPRSSARASFRWLFVSFLLDILFRGYAPNVGSSAPCSCPADADAGSRAVGRTAQEPRRPRSLLARLLRMCASLAARGPLRLLVEAHGVRVKVTAAAAPPGPAAGPDPVGPDELDVLRALDGVMLAGKAIARKVGLRYGPRLRTRLAALRKRQLLGHAGEGYFLTPAAGRHCRRPTHRPRTARLPRGEARMGTPKTPDPLRPLRRRAAGRAGFRPGWPRRVPCWRPTPTWPPASWPWPATAACARPRSRWRWSGRT